MTAWPYSDRLDADAEQDRADEEFDLEQARRDRVDEMGPADRARDGQTAAARRDIEGYFLR